MTSRGAPLGEDIASWKDGQALFMARVKRMKEDPVGMQSRRVRLERLSPLELYALMTEFIAPRPNGIMTLLIRGKPLDNPVWWDFVISARDHLVAVMSGADGLAADVYEAPDDFDVEQFLEHNCLRHRNRIESRTKVFERHEVYANAFYSYRRIAEWLRSELDRVDETPPPFRGGIRDEDDAVEAEFDALKAYGPTTIRFHVMAKSLVTNSAFMCEALVTTLLRVGALPRLAREPRVLKPLLRSSFLQKVQVLHAYTVFFADALNTDAAPVKRVLSLMEKRNKLVHAEESAHTRLEDVYFDGDIPLYGGGPEGQLVDFYRRTFLMPSRSDAMEAVAVAEEFCQFVLGAVRAELRDEAARLLEMPQLGYNTLKRVYSVPFRATPFQSQVIRKRNRSATETRPDSPDRHGKSGSVGDASSGEVPMSTLAPQSTREKP